MTLPASSLTPDKLSLEPVLEGGGATGGGEGKKPCGTVDDKSPETLEQRRRDLQSKADRLEAELRRVQPLVQAVQSRPDIQDMLRKPVAPVERPEDKKPVAPQKPESYDAVAAFSDPTSESFKYQRSLERYRDEKDAWFERRDRQREEAEINQRRQVEMSEAARQMIADTQRTLVAEHGFKPEEAVHFAQWATDDESVTLENLIAFYRTVHKKPASGPVGRKPASFGPIPSAATGGTGGPQELDPSKEFNDALKQNPMRKTGFPRKGT